MYMAYYRARRVHSRTDSPLSIILGR